MSHPRRLPWPKIGRVALVVTIVAVAGMWVYIYSGAADTTPPDTLEDRAFARRAEAICSAARERIDALPPAEDAPDAAARADVVDEANDDLRAMVADLREAAPSAGEDGRIVGLWLDDWETYIGDRQDWADTLRRDPKAQFFETDRGGEQISRAIDNLAAVNDMASCATTGDV